LSQTTNILPQDPLHGWMVKHPLHMLPKKTTVKSTDFNRQLRSKPTTVFNK